MDGPNETWRLLVPGSREYKESESYLRENTLTIFTCCSPQLLVLRVARVNTAQSNLMMKSSILLVVLAALVLPARSQDALANLATNMPECSVGSGRTFYHLGVCY